MTLLREVVETFIRLIKPEIAPNAVLVPADDVFEVPKVASFVLQGPTPVEDAARRCPAPLLLDDRDAMTFTETAHPRLYHLDFGLVATAGDAPSVLDIQETTTRFFQTHPTLPVGERGALNLTLLVPLGGWRRVNLSNLRQVSGRCRVEDCPVYDDTVREGRLIHTRIFEFRGGITEDAAFGPQT